MSRSLAQEWQSNSGSVYTTTTPSVQYTYADGANGSGVAAYMRLAQTTYPNSGKSTVNYNYPAGVDSIMSLLGSITDGSGNVEAAYRYLGAGNIVTEDYQQAQVKLDYSANNFAAWDQFGRVLDQVWSGYGQGNSGTLDAYQYAYNAAGDRTSRAESYTNNGTLAYGPSQSFQYDALDRLTSWTLGGVQQQAWNLDSLGNDLTSGSYDASNEETPTGGGHGLRSGRQHDDARLRRQGDLRRLGPLGGGQERIDDPGNVCIRRHEPPHPGFHELQRQHARYGDQRLLQRPAACGERHRDQRREERLSVRLVAALHRRPHSPRRAELLRQRRHDLAGLLPRRRQLQRHGPGERQQRPGARAYTYTPYGVVSYYNASWTNVGSSANANTILYSGHQLDTAISLYYCRARYYDPSLQRFVSQDPMGYAAGDENRIGIAGMVRQSVSILQG